VVDFAHTCVPAVDGAGGEDASLPPPADAGNTEGDLDAGSGTDAGDAAVDAGP
jgi:hypothetical protein